MKQKVLVIVGPTAIGKSALAVKLAKKLNGEIISGDSRQVYKGLDIGTAKITKEEMRGVPHHLLNVADPKKVFSASDYKTLATTALKNILEKNKLPIIVGGTGFYIDALIGRMNLPEVPPNKKLREKLEKQSLEDLFKLLQKKDPERAKNIDSKNKVRLIRALEIISALGKVPAQTKTTSDYKFIFIGLTEDQEKLDKKIEKRLMRDIENGLINEVKNLYKKGLTYKRMESLGLEYKYVAHYLQNKLSKDEMVEKLNREIRQYSKRQITWFKTNKQIKWFKTTEAKSILPYVLESIR